MPAPTPLDDLLAILDAQDGVTVSPEMGIGYQGPVVLRHLVNVDRGCAPSVLAAIAGHGWNVTIDRNDLHRLDLPETPGILLLSGCRMGDLCDALGDVLMTWDAQLPDGLNGLVDHEPSSPIVRTVPRVLPVDTPGRVSAATTFTEQLTGTAYQLVDSRPFGAAYTTGDPVAHTAGVLAGDAAGVARDEMYTSAQLNGLAHAVRASLLAGQSILDVARGIERRERPVTVHTANANPGRSR